MLATPIPAQVNSSKISAWISKCIGNRLHYRELVRKTTFRVWWLSSNQRQDTQQEQDVGLPIYI